MVSEALEVPDIPAWKLYLVFSVHTALALLFFSDILIKMLLTTSKWAKSWAKEVHLKELRVTFYSASQSVTTCTSVCRGSLQKQKSAVQL